ncbi:hypothetical protein AWJ20_4511 [Sugiyamaella lignohabitans]|uniref:DUF2415 domain-containing protein n=1 Tax=Sugiyamaella lignohabitans TaxID=796027 RepID=A0A167CH70_9ASCO|nr:uncharacterized protein AWJ20_4511 [Sugiyamaella lignohabitans]ANB11690.1 hypothetical protein AWJ20_4511 [Sugiyamaella lignohabitans]
MMFGAAFQDGMARLYDIRNLKVPLTKIKSARPNELMGAFRCLKFSNGPEDLMFLSEQMERVHIIDLRDFENRQVLTVPSNFSCSNYTETSTTNEMSYDDDAAESAGEDEDEDMDDDDEPSFTSPVRMGMLSGTSNPGPSSSTSLPRPVASLSTVPIPGVYIPGRHRHHRSSSVHPPLSSPTIQSYRDLVSQHQHSQFSRLTAQQSEYGLSGISWTAFDGGTIAVGTGSGIGLWKIDSRSRRTFPSFTIR